MRLTHLKKVRQKIRHRLFINVSTEKNKFKYGVNQIKWNHIIKTLNKYFPKVKIKIKAKTVQNPWITKVITMSSKKKQELYECFLKKLYFTGWTEIQTLEKPLWNN